MGRTREIAREIMVGAPSRGAAVAVWLLYLSFSVAEDVTLVEELRDIETGTPIVSVVSSVAEKLQSENARLVAQNAALRTKPAVDHAKQKILIAGGVIKATKKAKKKKKIAMAAKHQIPTPSNLQPTMKKGLSIINKYESQSKVLSSKVQKLMAKIDAMKQAKAKRQADLVSSKAKAPAVAKGNSAASYSTIPWFKFNSAAKTAKGVKTLAGCQNICDAQPACKSFSWARDLQQCLWSVDQISYDPEFTMATKAAISSSVGLQWREFPGMKWAAPNANNKEHTSAAQCKALCAKDASCKTYSYKASTNFCTLGPGGLAYSSHFFYYAKKVQAGPYSKAAKTKAAARKHEAAVLKTSEVANKHKEAKQQLKLTQENSQKERTKEIWLKNKPTVSQEKRMKSSIQQQVKAMNAKLASKVAAQGAKRVKQAVSQMEKDRLKLLTKASTMETSLKAVQKRKLDARKKVVPLAVAESKMRSLIATLATKIKLKDIDVAEAQKSLKRAKLPMHAKQQNVDEEAKIAAKAAIGTATTRLQKYMKQSKDLKAKLLASKKLHQKEHVQYLAAVSKEKEMTAMAKTTAAGMEEKVKALKNVMRKARLAMWRDRRKAYAAQVIAAKANYKVASEIHAKTKVVVFHAKNTLQTSRTPEERRENDQMLGKAKLKLFKATKSCSDNMRMLVDTAAKLSAVKERLHKAEHKGKVKTTRALKKNLAKKMAEAASPV